MSPFTSILCAIDFSPLAPRVLRHAVGFAGALGARLTVITVSPIEPRQAEATVTALLRDTIPRGATYVAEPVVKVVRVAVGQPADAILALARDGGADLIVAGTHSRSELSRWLLGSTSAAIMEEAACATLLVPPGTLEIVTLGPDAVTLRPGTVLAAVDLAECNQRQLAIAGRLATLARQPLTLMTVAGPSITDRQAEQELQQRAQKFGATADRLVVRRGLVHDAIDHAAVAEHAGLVVMGLRARGHGVPGRIASAVLKAKDAVVLAVPEG